MQAERLQGVQEELLAVRQRVEPLQKKQQKELLKGAPDESLLIHLKEAIAPLAAIEQKLLEERGMLGTQPQGEQWGTAPDAWLPLCWAHTASWGQRTDCHLTSQVVAVGAVGRRSFQGRHMAPPGDSSVGSAPYQLGFCASGAEGEQLSVI